MVYAHAAFSTTVTRPAKDYRDQSGWQRENILRFDELGALVLRQPATHFGTHMACRTTKPTAHSSIRVQCASLPQVGPSSALCANKLAYRTNVNRLARGQMGPVKERRQHVQTPNLKPARAMSMPRSVYLSGIFKL